MFVSSISINKVEGGTLLLDTSVCKGTRLANNKKLSGSYQSPIHPSIHPFVYSSAFFLSKVLDLKSHVRTLSVYKWCIFRRQMEKEKQGCGEVNRDKLTDRNRCVSVD